jgi:hypothetical protein
VWIFTEFGFFSIVAHRTKPETVLVRGRCEKDVQEFQRRAGIRAEKVFEDWGADYPYRLELPKVAAAKVLMDATLSLNYDNFKNRVARAQGWERSNTYHDVWAVLADQLS